MPDPWCPAISSGQCVEPSIHDQRLGSVRHRFVAGFYPATALTWIHLRCLWWFGSELLARAPDDDSRFGDSDKVTKSSLWQSLQLSGGFGVWHLTHLTVASFKVSFSGVESSQCSYCAELLNSRPHRITRVPTSTCLGYQLLEDEKRMEKTTGIQSIHVNSIKTYDIIFTSHLIISHRVINHSPTSTFPGLVPICAFQNERALAEKTASNARAEKVSGCWLYWLYLFQTSERSFSSSRPGNSYYN